MIASRRRMTILVSRTSDVASCKSGGAVQGDASGASGRKNGNGAVLTPYPAATYASQIFLGPCACPAPANLADSLPIYRKRTLLRKTSQYAGQKEKPTYSNWNEKQ
jgi:hypothetical protein